MGSRCTISTYGPQGAAPLEEKLKNDGLGKATIGIKLWQLGVKLPHLQIGDSSLQLDCFALTLAGPGTNHVVKEKIEVNRKPRHNKSQCAPKPIVGLSKCWPWRQRVMMWHPFIPCSESFL